MANNIIKLVADMEVTRLFENGKHTMKQNANMLRFTTFLILQFLTHTVITRKKLIVCLNLG